MCLSYLLRSERDRVALEALELNERERCWLSSVLCCTWVKYFIVPALCMLTIYGVFVWVMFSNIYLPAEEFGRLGISGFCEARQSLNVKGRIVSRFGKDCSYMFGVDYSNMEKITLVPECDNIVMPSCSLLFIFSIVSLVLSIISQVIKAILNRNLSRDDVKALAAQQKLTPGDKVIALLTIPKMALGIARSVIYMEIWLTNDKLEALDCYKGTVQLTAYTKFTEWCLAFFVISLLMTVISLLKTFNLYAKMSGGGGHFQQAAGRI